MILVESQQQRRDIMKGQEILELAHQATREWRRSAEAICRTALEELFQVARYGNTTAYFDKSAVGEISGSITSPVIQIARQLLREEGITLRYHHRDDAFTVSVNKRACRERCE